MTRWTPDPTFYPSPRMAQAAPAEGLGYVALVDPGQTDRPDALGVIDLDPRSSEYGNIVATLEMPNVGDELHHFGWNACSAALCPSAPHPHVERRYLLVPGLRSSRIHVVDVKPDPRSPKLVKIDRGRGDRQPRPATAARTPIHCGPDGIYVIALGAPDGDGPGGIFLLDYDDFDPLGRLGGRPRPAVPRLRLLVAPRPRHAADERVGHARTWSRTASTPSCCWATQYGHQLHVWDLRRAHATCRRSTSAPSTRWCSSCARRTTRASAYGFVGVVVSTAGPVRVGLAVAPRRRHGWASRR